MKRSISNREDRSFRPAIGSRVSSSGSRFPSQTNYERRQLPIITQANLQAMHSCAAIANQIQANRAALNRRMPWGATASQINRQLSSSWTLRGRPQNTVPRFFWRKPIQRINNTNQNRFLRTPQRFQEPRSRIGWNFARSWRAQQPQFRNSSNQATRFFCMNRKWQVLPECSSTTTDDFTFSVISYNVLSDELLYENMYLYEECSDEVLRWEYRKENLLKELLGYNADILCLQEIDAGHFEDWFQPKLNEAGYSGVYNQRSGTKPDGCTTFFRNSKFSLVDKKLVKYYTKNIQVLDKDNVGIVVLLKPNTRTSEAHGSKSKREAALLCVANTHLLFNTKRGDIKLAQLAYLCAEIDSLATLSSDNVNNVVHCPVILCGDFNSLPNSPLHNLITTGQLDYSIRCPGIISGQLEPSQISSGSSSRSMATPLLPWALGITLNSQWRDPQDGNLRKESVDSTSDKERSKHDSTPHITIPFQFESVYKHSSVEDDDMVTTCHSNACCNVDYIFYTSGTWGRTVQRNNMKYAQRGTLTLLGKLDLLRKTDFNIIKLLPNSQFSSDHIALHALFKLT